MAGRVPPPLNAPKELARPTSLPVSRAGHTKTVVEAFVEAKLHCIGLDGLQGGTCLGVGGGIYLGFQGLQGSPKVHGLEARFEVPLS